MPVGSSIYRLFVSIRSIGVNVFGSWPTPLATDGKDLIRTPRMAGDFQKLGQALMMQLGLWRTPTASDDHRGNVPRMDGRQEGLTNQVAARLGLWGTPRASISLTRSSSRRAKNLARIEDQIFLLDMMVKDEEDTDTGIPPYWFRVRMDARGRYLPLNPEFTRWLMGYPSEWDAYVPMGTRSSRKLARDSLNST